MTTRHRSHRWCTYRLCTTTNLRHKYSVDFRIVNKVLKDLESFSLWCRSIEVGFVKSDSISFQCKHIVREDDNLIIPLLMVSDKKLTGSTFVWVHHIEKLKIKHSRSYQIYDICNWPFGVNNTLQSKIKIKSIGILIWQWYEDSNIFQPVFKTNVISSESLLCITWSKLRRYIYLR